MIQSDGERQAPTKVSETEPSHLARYAFALGYALPDNVILDAPCGSGYGTRVLASRAAKVYGMDISEGAIRHAQEFFSSPSNSFHVGNVERMVEVFPDSSCLDLIVSFEGIEHLENPDIFLKEAKRLLKPEGKIIISTPRKPHGSPYHKREYSLEEFKNELETCFKIERMYGQIFTKVIDLAVSSVNPSDYRRFNFIAECSPR
ncbi:class I SAM-dependent methyltransferase [Candidatus Woesearchaeota archaeon]|nr:class I SAM-dependent methyltransferase [Candidatus Woesearchaeota archaeon]